MSLFDIYDAKGHLREFKKTVGDDKPKKSTLSLLLAMRETTLDSTLLRIVEESFATALVDEQESRKVREEPKNPDASSIRMEQENFARNVALRANEIFAERAKETLYTFLSENLSAYKEDPERQLLHKHIQSLSEGYKSANYNQVFLYMFELLLKVDPEMAKMTGGEEFLSGFRSAMREKIATSFDNPLAYEGWSNYETYAADYDLHHHGNDGIDLHIREYAKEAIGKERAEKVTGIDAICREIVAEQAKSNRDYGSFVRACALQHYRLMRALATKQGCDNKFFGKYKDVNFFEIAISRIDEMKIKEIIINVPRQDKPDKKVSLFILPHEDPIQVIKENCGLPHLRMERKSPYTLSGTRFLDREGRERFTIRSVEHPKIHMYTIHEPGEYTGKVGVYREEEEQVLREYLSKSYDDCMMQINENDDMVMLDKNGNARCVCHCFTKNSAAPYHTQFHSNTYWEAMRM